jgi:hypothetical protein
MSVNRPTLVSGSIALLELSQLKRLHSSGCSKLWKPIRASGH